MELVLERVQIERLIESYTEKVDSIIDSYIVPPEKCKLSV
jgi:hypothetical protein